MSVITPRTRARRERTQLALVVLALFMLHAVLNRYQVGPKIFADEAGYLAHARYFAGVGRGFNMNGANFYQPGLSLLIAPLVQLFEGSPVWTYRSIVLLNGLLASATVVPFYVLARRLGGSGHATALLCAAVAGMYPALLLASNFVMAESMFLFVFAMLIVFGGRVLHSPSLPRLVGFAVSVAYLYLIHPKALALLFGVTVLWLVLRAVGRLSNLQLATALGSLAIAHAGSRLLDGVLRNAMYFGHFERITSEREVLARLTEPRAWGSAGLLLIGQSWYLMVTSLGLVGIGAWVLLGRVWPIIRFGNWRHLVEHEDSLTGTFLLISSALMFLMVILSSVEPTRADHLIYGRYNEGWSPLFLLLGLVWCASITGLRQILGAAAASAVATGALGVGLLVGRGPAALANTLNYANILGLQFAVWVVGSLRVLRISAIAVALGLMFWLIASKSGRAAVSVAGLLFLGSASGGQTTYVDPLNETAVARLQIRDELHELRLAGRPLSLDETLSPGHLWYETQLMLPESRFEFFKSSMGEVPQTDLGISSLEAGAQLGDSTRIVYLPSSVDLGFYIRPGRLQNQMEGQGWLLPSGWPRQLPRSALHSRILVGGGVRSMRLAEGETGVLTLNVTHAGGGSPWPTWQPGADPLGRVRVSWQIHEVGDDGRFVDRGWADFTRMLRPEDRATVKAYFPNPETEVRRGDYVVRVELIQVGFTSFDRDETVSLPLHVR